MNTVRRFFLPLLVLLVAGGVGLVLLKTGPKPQRKPPQPAKLTVETLSLKPDAFTLRISSQGVVNPSLRSGLTSEVAGRMVEVSPRFVPGAFVEKGEILARIDPESYRLQVENLDASVQIVNARLEELELSRLHQKKRLVIEQQSLALAERQFNRLSTLKKSGTVTESSLEQGERELLSHRSTLLTLNNTLDLIPAQRHNLEAERQLKQAQREAAQLDLDRTAIIAPFAGRIVEKQADLGQFVNKGQTLGEIHATDRWEIRLPVSYQELSLLDLDGLGTGDGRGGHGPSVTLLSSREESPRAQWQGEIIRMESTVDPQTRQVILVARIDSSPHATTTDPHSTLLAGRFVEASIQGRTLQNVFILPRHTVGPGDRLLIISPDNHLERRVVDVLWRDGQSVVVRQGLTPSERISLTPLPYAPEGALVSVAGAQKKTEDNKGNP